MSLFPRSFVTNDQTAVPPIFLLLDEFDRYSRNADRPASNQVKSYNPKFDIKESKDSYQLFGELPGIDQKQVEMQFTDASTLTIKGRSERSYAQEGNNESTEKFWVMERNVGEFSRSFGFPTAIDQDKVKASMNNGILSVLVPKIKKQEARKIMIE